MNAPVYLDYNATTPVDARVAKAVEACLYQHFGNPSSTHVFGRDAHQVVEQARQQVALLIGAEVDEVVFCGCATEANNLAIRGVARALRDQGRHLVTCAIEHPAVEQPMQRLAEDGWEVSVLPVDNQGLVSLGQLQDTLREDTVLVSIMHANNEVGTIQPLAEISAMTRARGILLHTDAAQSAGKISVNVDDLGVDLLTLAGHKFYATKGVGALYVRRGTPLNPLLVGAGHEGGLRPGTENVPAIAGIGEAARIAHEHKPGHGDELRRLRDRLHAQLADVIPGLQLNGHPEQRLPNTLNLSFPGVDGRDLLAHAAEAVAASVGSACHEEGDAVSGVLGAMGIEAQRARGAVRLSLGAPSTGAEIERASDALIAAWRTLTR
jgi:cysteine desulfurase